MARGEIEVALRMGARLSLGSWYRRGHRQEEGQERLVALLAASERCRCSTLMRSSCPQPNAMRGCCSGRHAVLRFDYLAVRYRCSRPHIGALADANYLACSRGWEIHGNWACPPHFRASSGWATGYWKRNTSPKRRTPLHQCDDAWYVRLAHLSVR